MKNMICITKYYSWIYIDVCVCVIRVTLAQDCKYVPIESNYYFYIITKKIYNNFVNILDIFFTLQKQLSNSD